jgi:acetyl-CoA acetyltransferase
MGLRPFVETRPATAKAGAAIEILGSVLAGATSVTFNGTPATFAVNTSGTAISATVPIGATSGTIQVVTPSGTLSSNVPFRVRP